MSNELLDVEGVKKKFGVPPEKFLDYLALIGDQIDNIPGVDKVGPKTACRWIEKYGSLEGVLAHADEITGLAGENLRKMRDWPPKARRSSRSSAMCRFPSMANSSSSPIPRANASNTSASASSPGCGSGRGQPAAPSVQVASTVGKRKYRAIFTEEELKGLALKIEAVELVGFDTLCDGDDPMSARLAGLFARSPTKRSTCRSATTTPARRAK